MSATAGVVIAGEVAKVLLQLYFQQLQLSGLSAEESEKLYMSERMKFLSNDPAKIPNV